MAFLGQARGDPSNAQPFSPERPRAFLGLRRDRTFPAQAHSGLLPLRKRLACPLTDQPPLELSERRHDVRHDLPARRRGVDVHVERHQAPRLLLGRRHDACEVEHRPR
jgi:hypothetical protein